MRDEPLDARTGACVSIAWIVFFNKPLYPLYVWGLIGAHAVYAALGTLVAAPLFLALPYVARRSPFAARVGLPILGFVDSVWATKLFGPAGGTELFFAPCAILVMVGLEAREYRPARAILCAMFAAFFALHGRYGAPLASLSAEDSAILFNLDMFAVASLVAFIGLRFSRIR